MENQIWKRTNLTSLVVDNGPKFFMNYYVNFDSDRSIQYCESPVNVVSADLSRNLIRGEISDVFGLTLELESRKALMVGSDSNMVVRIGDVFKSYSFLQMSSIYSLSDLVGKEITLVHTINEALGVRPYLEKRQTSRTA